jgi:DNA-binding CsgD family transcriptional regulator
VDEAEIIGRDAELHAISAFLEPSVEPGALLIEGAAGIGKTTLWRSGVERATERGWRVLTAGPAAAESRLAFAAIGDLLGDEVHAVASELPEPQKHALDVALLLDEPQGAPPNERAVAVAALGALRVLARDRSVLIAVDDVQWLDRASADVLSFVARRLGDDPVALLLAQRTDEASGVPLGLERAFGNGLRRVQVPPLTLGATHRLLNSHLGVTLPRPTLRRVHVACAGNPFFALEIGRVLKERPTAADEPLPVPHDIEQLAGRRIEQMSAAGRAAVLAAALLAEPTVAIVERATDRTGLEEAVAAGIVVADGHGLRFAHPLFAESATWHTTDTRRRDMHLRLAALLPDSEARTQHLALGTSEPAGDVALTIERAAEDGRWRGARSSAAALMEHAARLTPHDDVDDLARRVAKASHWWIDAGDTRRSVALLEQHVDRLPPGPRRLDALHAKARAVEDRGACRAILEDALAEADGYPGHEVIFLFGICYALNHALEFDDSRERARTAVEVAERNGDQELLVLALGMAGGLHVGQACLETLHRARELERDLDWFDPYDSPGIWLARWLLESDELDVARSLFLEQQERAIGEGDDWSRAWILCHLAEVECRAGNYEAAGAYAETGLELAEQTDHVYVLNTLLYSRALVAAHVGDSIAARAAAEESLAAAQAVHSRLFAIRPRIVLAFLAVSERRYEEALQHLDGLAEVALRGPYWVAYPFWGDLFEALTSLGQLGRAESLLAELGALVHAERPGTAPVLARCRGLVLAASGSLDEAAVALEESLRLQQERPVPLESARTLLALGEVHRRAKRRRIARETLQEAHDRFTRLGARLWAERTEKEMARIGGRAPAGDELTPSERQIAELVAEGMTNKEVAAVLVVADRTIESALTQIYRKLDVRSRTELTRKLAEGDVLGAERGSERLVGSSSADDGRTRGVDVVGTREGEE